MGNQEFFPKDEVLPRKPEPEIRKDVIASDRETALILAQQLDSLSGPSGMSLEEHEKEMEFYIKRAKKLLLHPEFVDPNARKIVEEALERAGQVH